MMKVKECSAPDLKMTRMKCDKPLNEKLNKFELTKHLNQHATNLYIGKPRSGKTTLINGLFGSKDVFNKTFHRVYLFQPIASRASMEKSYISQIPEENKYDDLTKETIDDVLEKIENEPENINNAIIIDDLTTRLKNKDTEKQLRHLVNNRRHLHTSIFLCVQSWKSIPLQIRKLFTNIFCFKLAKGEQDCLFDEMLELEKEWYNPIRKLVWKEPHDWLFINVDNNELFKKFDKIEIEEE